MCYGFRAIVQPRRPEFKQLDINLINAIYAVHTAKKKKIKEFPFCGNISTIKLKAKEMWISVASRFFGSLLCAYSSKWQFRYCRKKRKQNRFSSPKINVNETMWSFQKLVKHWRFPAAKNNAAKAILKLERTFEILFQVSWKAEQRKQKENTQEGTLQLQPVTHFICCFFSIVQLPHNFCFPFPHYECIHCCHNFFSAPILPWFALHCIHEVTSFFYYSHN